MKTNVFSRIWHRRYLTLDRYMSGKFIKVFLATFVTVLTIFCFLCLLSSSLKGWSAGDVFVQMTNPSPKKEMMDLTDWLLIVAVNLFGMFIVNGILLTLLINWISNRKDRFENGMSRYEIIGESKFSVIIGGHSMVARLAKRIMERDHLDYVLVQTKRSPSELRKEIFAEIKDPRQAANVIIYSGSRTAWHELEELNVVNSKEVFIIGENSDIDSNDHDSLNLKCWQLLRTHITEPKDRKLSCHVMFETQSIFTAFQTTDIDIDDTRTFRFIPFSIYEIWSRKALIGHFFHKLESEYIPLDGKEGLTYDSPGRVHLIISGSNKQALALLTEAAQLAHYPNFLNPEIGRPRTLISIIDQEAKDYLLRMKSKLPHLFQLARWRYVKAPTDIYPRKQEDWKIFDSTADINSLANTHYPWIDPLKTESTEFPFSGGYLGDDFIDIDLEFIEGSLHMPSVRCYLEDACEADSKHGRLTLAICDDDPSAALETALSLPAAMYSRALQILVQQQTSSTIVDGIRKGNTGSDTSKYQNLRSFGMIVETDYFGLFEARLPKYVAYAYDAINRGTSFDEEYQKSGDIKDFNRQVENVWLDITPDGGKTCIAKRWSNFYSANNFYSKLRSAGKSAIPGSTIQDPDILEILAKTEHNRWVMEQLLLGMCPPSKDYAGLLPIEDPALRKTLKSHGIHPDLISNDKLGSTSRYDVEIVRIIPLAIDLSYKEGCQ